MRKFLEIGGKNIKMNGEISNKSWIKEVDFAWLGSDSEGHLGLFYVSGELVPDKIEKKYDLESYNLLTDYIIDELEPSSEIVEGYSKRWAIQDAMKGVYVFEFNEENRIYKKIAEPKKPITKDNFISKLNSSAIIDIKNINFLKDDEYSENQINDNI